MRFTKLSLTCLILVMTVFLSSSAQTQTISAERLYNRASQQFWDGKYRQAEATYERIVENHSDHSLYWDARFGLAQSLYEQGKLKPARKHFRAVRQHHPNKFVRGDALYSLAEIAILMNRTIRAQRFLETFINVFPEHVLVPTARKQLNVLEKVGRATPPSYGSGRRNDQPRQSKNSDSPKNPRLKSADTSVGAPRSIINPLDSSSSDTPTKGSQNSDQSSMEPSIKTSQPDTKTLKTKSQTTSSTSTGRISPFAGTNASGLESNKPTPKTVGKNRSSKQSAIDTADRKKVLPPPEVTSRNQSNTKPIDGSNERSSGLTGDTTSRRTTSETSSKRTVPNPSPDDQASRTETDSKNKSGLDEKATAPSSSEILSRARKLHEKGQYKRAKQLVDSLLDGKPASPEPYRLAAEIAVKQGSSSEKVLSYLNQAIKRVDGISVPMSLMKTELLIEEKRFKDALTTLNRLDPSSLSNSKEAQYHYLRGKIALERGNSDESFFHFMDAVRASPSSKWAERARTTINTRL